MFQFSKLTVAEKKADGPAGPGKKGRVVKAINVSDLLDEDKPKKKGADAAAVAANAAGAQGKFKLVEKKPPPKKKPKPVAEPETVEEVDDEWVVQQKNLAKAQKAVEKKFGKGPVGSAVVDPAEEKRQLKAAASLRKHLEKQTIKVKSGGAVTEVKPIGDTAVADDADALPAAKPSRVEAAAPAKEKGGAKFADPTAADLAKLQLGGKAAGAKKSSGTAAADAAHAKHKAESHKAAIGGGGGGGKKAGGGGGAALPGKGGATALDKLDHETLVHHAHTADGAAVAGVRIGFLVSTHPKLLLLPEDDAAMAAAAAQPPNKQTVATPARIVAELDKKGAIKAGLMVSVEGKHFTDTNTADVPFMLVEYAKALENVHVKPVGTAVACHPFEVAKKVGGEDTELCEVKFRVADCRTALHLDHAEHSAARVQLRSAKVAMRAFVGDFYEELRRLAVAQGMRTMLREAMALVENYVTTVPEVVRTLFAN